jgi:biotin operon repressor
MDFFARLEQFARLDQLIRLKATGTPKQLAEKIGISRRQLLRDIAQLKARGFPIDYCKYKQCYYYSQAVKMNFEVIIGAAKLMAIKGGEGETVIDCNLFLTLNSTTYTPVSCSNMRALSQMRTESAYPSGQPHLEKGLNLP